MTTPIRPIVQRFLDALEGRDPEFLEQSHLLWPELVDGLTEAEFYLMNEATIIGLQAELRARGQA